VNDAEADRLGVHETTYLAMVGEQFDGLSPGRRAELLALVAENLDERPPALSWDALLADLGTPATYAAQLVDGPLPRPPRTPQQRLTRRRRWLAGAVAAAFTLAVLTPVIGRTIRDTTSPKPAPEFSTGCTGAQSDDPRFTVEYLEAAGAHEYRMDVVDGLEFRIPVCLGSSQPVVVLDIALFTSIINDHRFEMSDDFPFQVVRSEPSRTNPGDQTAPPTPEVPVEIGPGTGIDVDLVLRFGTCTERTGSRTGVNAVAVTYRYDGEEITEAVDLGALYSVRDVGSCTHEA
jgi:hypothetical protein